MKKITSILNKRFYHQHIPLKKEDVKNIILHNRTSLNKVANWIDKDSIQSSVFRYGIPEYIDAKINRPINTDVTYTDLICYLSEKIPSRIEYLEIGVSVGKNFFQLLNFFSDANLTAFDIETINPILQKEMTFEAKIEWDTKRDSIKKSKSSLSQFSFGTNKVDYLNGDEWDTQSWKKLKGKKFNIIFSDALHEPDALLYEYNMIQEFGLLDEQKFLMVWDDLGGEMSTSFISIYKSLRRKYHLSRNNCFIVPLNGWLGEHEHQHQIGIITNLI